MYIFTLTKTNTFLTNLLYYNTKDKFFFLLFHTTLMKHTLLCCLVGINHF